MGKHFVAQRHLRGFQSPEKPGWIWMFDKVRSTSKHLPISQVAQAPGFYPEEVESELTRSVEAPGLSVIEKLVAGGRLDETDRRHLTYYIAAQMKRVPRTRIVGHEMAPGVIDEVTRELIEHIEEAARQGWIDESRRCKLLEEAESVRLKSHENTPQQMLDQINAPWPFESWLVLIHSMQWRLLKRPGPSSFLISDNPAYFFPGLGIKPPDGEIILPLTSEYLLHCGWQGSSMDVPLVEHVTERLVKMLNRRIASGATRCIFYHCDESWIFSAAMNKQEQLDRLNWTN